MRARFHPSRFGTPFARLVAALAIATAANAALAAGHSLRFFGTGSGDVDRVKIRIDDPANALPGPAADVGAADFTIELWIKASAASNTAPAVACGANTAWRSGNIVVDRDRFNQDRKLGISIAGGKVVFGVSGDATGDMTLCSVSSVLDGAWHHVAAERRRSDGYLRLFVDGNLEAQADGPNGDVSYPDNAAPANANDPFLVLGAEKYDVGPASFNGWIDELRISTKLRYWMNFSRPRAPFVPDRFTAALYHFDEGDGATLHDVATARGARANGLIKRGGASNGPQWAPDSPFNVGSLAANATIALTPFVSGFSSPIDIVNANDGSGRLYVVQQGGLIRIIKNGAIVPTPFLDVTTKISAGGERGLLGLAFHPSYRRNGRYFVYYTNGNGDLVIERYQRAAGNIERTDPDPLTVHTLLVIPHPGQSNHNGGKLAFGPDGYLYAGTGDGGSGNDPPNNAQTLGVRLGKMLRLDVDVDVAPYYAIPPSNPFAALTCNGAGVGTCPEIWAYGLRNPWRFSFDRLTGDHLIGDVGQGSREEIDWQPAGTPGGRNYGWKVMEGTICTPGVDPNCTPPPNYVGPILEYAHDANGGISVTGGYRYRGNRVPVLAGAYLYGDYGSQRLWAATVDDNGTWTTTYIGNALSSLSAFGEDEAGELYVAGYGNGIVYRVAPVDTDGDGLPDWWENAYFGNPTAASVGLNADGDTADNLSEYLYNTDPLNPMSFPTAPPNPPSIAVYRPAANRFLIDVDGDRAPDYKPYFGAPGDVPLAGRVDTDGRNDLVVYRGGVWYADFDRDGVSADTVFYFGGVVNDQPLLADFNGDGRDDAVIYRSNGTWYVSTAQNGVANTIFHFGGVAGDVALAGDVNGDGIADLVIFRDGFWYVDTNRDGIADMVVPFGAPGDIPLLFDYDGDGRADFVVVRNGIWYVSTQRNSIAQAMFAYGDPSDIPLGWHDR